MSIGDALPAPAETIPVRFDRNNPVRVTPLTVVEEMMMAWYERNPQQWGYWHATAMTGVEPAKTNRKAKDNGR